MIPIKPPEPKTKVSVRCPSCKHSFKVAPGVLMGKLRSEKKAAANAKNGRKGGRPLGTTKD